MSDVALIVLADAAVWASWSVVVGYGAHRLPPRALDHDGGLTRLRRWEAGGRAYERLGIHRWKDRLPDFGPIFGGGASKRSVPGLDDESLRSFAAETRRAELVHWAIPAITPLLALWNPPALMAAMIAYALLANGPCLLVQRYNRGRILAILAGRDRRRARSAGS